MTTDINKRLSVADIKTKDSGERVHTTLLVRASSDRETRAGSPYVAMTLGDATGEIESRAWKVSGAPPVGSVLEVGGKLNTYQGETQLIIDKWTVLEASDEDLMELISSAPVSGRELLIRIYEHVETYCSGALRDVVHYAIDSLPERLETWPAASGHHHARFAGLAQHVESMLGIAISLGSHYGQRYDHEIDLGLVVAAIVFHDLAKVHELTGPVGTEYTDAGRLIGHISMGDTMLTEAVEAAGPLDFDAYIHLRHLILSHHGQKAWGSPVEPMTPEAVFLHQIDMMDSRMDKVLTAVAAAPEEGGWVDAGYGQRYFTGRK